MSCTSPLAIRRQARAALALAVFATVAAVPVARAEITPEAQKVVARYVDAIGGREVVDAIRSMHVKATIEAFGLTGTTEVWSRKPNDRATRTEIGPFRMLTGAQGDSAWRTDPTGKTASLDGKDLEEARAEAWFENEDWLAADQGSGNVVVVTEPEAGKDYVVLEMTPPNGRPRRLWFSLKTGLLDKMTARLDQQTIVSTNSDYRPAPAPAGGKARLVPYAQLTQVVGQPANDLKLHVDSLEVNPEIADARFAPPVEKTDVVRFLGAPGVAKLEFEYLGRHVWLRASVNGHEPADFIYDTGASVTVIDSAYAAKIGLATEGSLQGTGAGSTGSASLSKIETLRVEGTDGDGVEMKDQSVAVLSVNPFLAPFFWRDCAGVIGHDFITRFVNEIDFDAKTLVLYDPKTFEYKGSGKAIPMRIAGTVPVVTMKIDDQYEGEFRLDVGSSSTVDLHTPFVKQHDLVKQAGRDAIQVTGGGFGGMFTSTLTRMKKIAVGPYSWTDPLVVLSSASSGALASEDYAGNVGNQILERFIVTLDYDHRMLYLEPGKQYAKRDQFSRSGVQLARYGDTVKAMQVIPGSPAAKAGVRVGDEIVSIDGTAVLDYGAERLRELFEEHEIGSKVPLVFMRDGKKRKATIKLAEIL